MDKQMYSKAFWMNEIWDKTNPDEPLYIFQMRANGQLVNVFEPGNPEHIDSYHCIAPSESTLTRFEQFTESCQRYVEEQARVFLEREQAESVEPDDSTLYDVGSDPNHF